MEPLTLITSFVGPVGIDRLLAALRGEPSARDIATDFLSKLAASEDRLHLRLAGIESRLDRIIAQSYTKALGLGIRVLADAANTHAERRTDEITAARRLFLEAASATSSPLETAVAERYALICAFALDHDGYARAAFGQLRRAAFQAAIQAAHTATNSYELACTKVGKPPQRAPNESRRDRETREKQENLVAQERRELHDAAVEVTELAVAALCEAHAFTVHFGLPAPPQITKVADGGPTTAHIVNDVPKDRVLANGGWLVTPADDAREARIGDVTATWDRITLVSTPDNQFMRINRKNTIFPGLTQWLDEQWPRSVPIPRDYLLVDATIRALGDLTAPVRVELLTSARTIPIPPVEPDVPAKWGTTVGKITADGEHQRLQLAIDADGSTSLPPFTYIVIQGTFVLDAPTITKTVD